ncbi:LysM peptidoglycan-binding domain-containing protein [Arthrobacter sp. efr-133-TYG-118]|uniref:LysM peptidoglycan-binding domain-containing protein n=1 Tax=Arthrobacter sp. efr-133-TYG-118 TaxID=3040279 RepID=UPI00255124B2|nr:LysM peptidoglycan-binding domain-containing protein [Arthrobacter sp. efr-133-TYG-118]
MTGTMTRTDLDHAGVDKVDPTRSGRDPGAERRPERANLSNGPVLAAGLMAAGGLLFAGWALGSAAHDDGGLLQALGKNRVGIAARAAETHTKDPVQDGTVTVTLPDVNHNGTPDAFENGAVTGIDPVTGKQIPVKPTETTTPPPPKPKPEVYLIKVDDTLTLISAETGVPIDKLVATNGIENPNLIYAGAALLIPPV